MKKSVTGITLAFCALASMGSHASETQLIRFGVEPNYPPFESKMPDGSLVGFDIDLGNAMCAELKAKCVWVEQGFDGMIPGLMAKKFDAILSGMLITEKRKQVINFTNRLYLSTASLMVRKGSGLQPTAESLRGKRIGVQKGTSQETFIRTYWAPKGVQVVGYQSQDQVYADVRAERLDGAVQSTVQAKLLFLGRPEGKNFELAGEPLRDDKIFGPGVGIGIRKDSPALEKDLNMALAKIKANGTYHKLMKKYFDFDISGG